MQITRNKTIHLLLAYQKMRKQRVWHIRLGVSKYLKTIGELWNEYEKIKNNSRV